MSIVKPFVGLPLISTNFCPRHDPGGTPAFREAATSRSADRRARLVDLDADSAEFLVNRLAEAGHFVRADIARIGIELGHHSFNRRLQQLPSIGTIFT